MEIVYSKTPFTRWLDVIDKKFGKPDLRELIILFWYASAGKTEFSYFVARSNANIGNSVCYISLELPEYDMKLRIARKSAGISKINWQNQNFSEEQRLLMEEKFEELNNTKWLYITKPETTDLWTIQKTIRTYYDLWCRMFMIDNLDKMVGKENDNARYQEISSWLQDMKNQDWINIILIHHAKKPYKKEQQYEPAGTIWLRGNQKITDNATQVIEVWRDLDPENTDPRCRAEVQLHQYKDTFEWANGYCKIYFNKWDYKEEFLNDMPF